MSSSATGRSLRRAANDLVGVDRRTFASLPPFAGRPSFFVSSEVAVVAAAPAAPGDGFTGVVWLPLDVTTTALSFACGA